MAHEIDMEVVAEGIETKEQVAFLKEINCDMIQGYYFARPMKKEDYEHYLSENE